MKKFKPTPFYVIILWFFVYILNLVNVVLLDINGIYNWLMVFIAPSLMVYFGNVHIEILKVNKQLEKYKIHEK